MRAEGGPALGRLAAGCAVLAALLAPVAALLGLVRLIVWLLVG